MRLSDRIEFGEIADEFGPLGPFLIGVDALIAAVVRELGAPVVSAGCDLVNETPKRVTDVETYQSVTIRRDISNIQRVFITQGGGILDDVWKHHAVEKLY